MEKMSEKEEEIPQDSCCLSPLRTLLVSFRILVKSPMIFGSIFALITLPLSLLLFALSMASHPIKSQIYHLEAVAALSSTRFEARHVWHESRLHAISLVRLHALFFFPCYALSLLAAITAVHSTALSCNGKRPTLQAVVAAARTTWKRPLVTTICVYALMLLYVVLQRALTTAAGRLGVSIAPMAVAAVGIGVELYVMAVMSVGVVVSVVEERSGWEALQVASGLMEGRRFSGWVFSGILASASGLIGWEMEEMMEGGDLKSAGGWTVMGRAMRYGDKVWLVCLFGMVVMWSYVVNTVFYCECRRRRQVSREEYEIPL